MTCKKFCIRRIGACVACLVLVINLVCTSYTRVEAAPVAGAYALEEIVGALLVSLGITSATGEALNKAGLTPENARTIINSVYASAKEFSHDTDEIINETIENAVLDAMETGKLIFKQGSQAWNALKAWAKSVGADIKGLIKPDTSAALASYYDLGGLSELEYLSYLGTVVKDMYANVGMPTPSNQLTLSNIRGLYGSYVLLITVWCYDETPEYKIYGFTSADFDRILTCSNWLSEKLTDKEKYTAVSYNNWYLYQSLDGAFSSYNNYIFGQMVDMRMLNPADARMWQRYSTPDIAMDNAYQTVYNPAIPDTTDVVTPSNTITRERDDSVAVAGDYVIDVALPVAFPVDLTKGIVIDRDIPIEDAIDRSKTDDKTDDKEDNKPVTPDMPDADVGAGLVADLKSIFPFCIPFDLIACIKGLAAEGEPPKWVMRIPMPLDYTWVITVDMADFEGVVKVLRAGEDVLFIIGLIMITRSLMIRG